MVQTLRVFDAWGEGAETTLPRSIDCWNYNAKWGYYYDCETSLYYCQNRMYDASTGRWINRDPIGYAGGINLYGYCGGGPVGAADSSGTMMLSVLEATMWNAEANAQNARLAEGDKTRRFPLIPQGYYFYTDLWGNVKAPWPSDPSPEEMNNTALMLVPAEALGRLPRRPTYQLIREWEDFNGQK